MFGWFKRRGLEKLEQETRKSFDSVKKDFQSVSKWIKHLDEEDKQLFDILNELKRDISTIYDEIEGMKEVMGLMQIAEKDEQLSKKTDVLNKQTAVYAVEEPVQTGVQTGNLYQILQGLSSSERLLVYTLMNSDLKLSYEDLARLLGKERSTIRGQINAIKQKSEGIIEELTEPNGKKRVFVRDEVKEKLAKYAKVRVKEKKKYRKLPKE